MEMPPSDRKVLLDIRDFKFHMNQPSCRENQVLVVLVHSAPHNREKRLQIRKTWGSILQGRLLFVLGEVESPLLQVRHSTYSPAKNGVFWDVTPCGSCKNRRFGGT
jgi:hypothetical protein